MQKIVIQTHSAAETMQLAEQMGSLLQAGRLHRLFWRSGCWKNHVYPWLSKGHGVAG